jgi:hypothetical protein
MGAGLIRSGLTLCCAPRHDFGARVIPDASAPMIDPRTKPASLPSRRNEFGVRHFSPPFPSHPIGGQPRYPCTVMGLVLSALDLRKLGITRGPWRSGFGKTLFLQWLVRPTSLTGTFPSHPRAPLFGVNRGEGDLTDTVHRQRRPISMPPVRDAWRAPTHVRPTL